MKTNDSNSDDVMADGTSLWIILDWINGLGYVMQYDIRLWNF